MAKPKLTLESLGHVDDSTHRLSASYANTRDNYKIVDTAYVIGYYIVGDGVRSHVRVAPIYDAQIWIRSKGGRAIIQAHEVGDYYNPTDGYHEDYAANLTAGAARLAIESLKTHHAHRQLRAAQQPQRKTRPKRKPRSR